MNVWDYVAAHPWGAFFLVCAIGWALATIVQSFSDRKCECCGKDKEWD